MKLLLSRKIALINNKFSGEERNYQKFLAETIGNKKKSQADRHEEEWNADQFAQKIKFIEGQKKPQTLLDAKSKAISRQFELQVGDSDFEDNQVSVAKRARESVKIPALYFEKTREERMKD